MSDSAPQLAPISVRLARLADVGQLLPMMVEFNREEGIAWDPALGEAAVRRLLAKADLGLVGLVSEGIDLVGYFVVTWGFDLEWGGRDAFLTELYVRPTHRRTGIGAAALEECENLARQCGASALHLMARNDNAAALRLYEGAGFTTPPRRFFTKSL